MISIPKLRSLTWAWMPLFPLYSQSVTAAFRRRDDRLVCCCNGDLTGPLHKFKSLEASKIPCFIAGEVDPVVGESAHAGITEGHRPASIATRAERVIPAADSHGFYSTIQGEPEPDLHRVSRATP